MGYIWVIRKPLTTLLRTSWGHPDGVTTKKNDRQGRDCLVWVLKKQRVVAMATWIGDGPRLDGWMGCLEIFFALTASAGSVFSVGFTAPPIQEAIVIVTTRMTLYVLVVDTMLPSLSTVTGCRVDPMNHLPFSHKLFFFVCYPRCGSQDFWTINRASNGAYIFQSILLVKSIYTVRFKSSPAGKS